MILVTASWCAPCNELKEWMYLTGNNEGIEYHDVDIDDLSNLPMNVRSIPALIVDGSLFTGNEEIRPFLSALNVVDL